MENEALRAWQFPNAHHTKDGGFAMSSHTNKNFYGIYRYLRSTIKRRGAWNKVNSPITCHLERFSYFISKSCLKRKNTELVQSLVRKRVCSGKHIIH